MKDLEMDARRGEHAERLLKDPLLSEVLQEMRATLYHNIETSHWRKQREREELYRMLKTIQTFEAQLEQRIRKGTKARATLASKLKNAFT